MEEIIVKEQKEMDAVNVDFGGIVKICGIGIRVRLKYKYRVVAWENSSVVARENSSVVARGNSSVVARENSSVEARENSSVVARGNSSVVAWGNSSVVAWDNSSVVAWDNSSVEAWGNSSVEARGNSCIRVFESIKKLCAYGFSVVFVPFKLKFKFKKEKTCLVQKFKPQKFLDREGVEIKKGGVILFKKVSKDFKTQKDTKNETLWEIGSTVTHPAWQPKESECGEGKFHASSRPYFCDEFRIGIRDDKYIAVQIAVKDLKDLYEWPNGLYPHKIAFRKGNVLYECDKFGKEKEGM